MPSCQGVIWPNLKVGLLLIAATFVNLANAEETDQQLLAKGMWHDPKTNLIWAHCVLGQQWTGSLCSGDKLKYTWDEAIIQASFARYAERTGWRVPRMDELISIVAYVDGVGAVLPSALCTSDSAGSYWSSSTWSSPSSGTGWFINTSYDDYYNNKIPTCYSTGSSFGAKSLKKYVRLVRSNN